MISFTLNGGIKELHACKRLLLGEYVGPELTQAMLDRETAHARGESVDGEGVDGDGSTKSDPIIDTRDAILAKAAANRAESHAQRARVQEKQLKAAEADGDKARHKQISKRA